MSKSKKQFETDIRHHLEAINKLEIDERFKKLQGWQSNRLFRTHENLYQERRFQPAMEFFMEELYGCEHFVARNQQLIRALHLMCRTMPATILQIVEDAAYLQHLSLKLDADLLANLPEGSDIENLSLTEWTAAYSACANRKERADQLDLIEKIGNELASIVHLPFIDFLLTWSAKPAKLAGYGDIHQFVTKGFGAFRDLNHPQEFLQPVISTERNLSCEWFS